MAFKSTKMLTVPLMAAIQPAILPKYELEDHANSVLQQDLAFLTSKKPDAMIKILNFIAK